MKRIAILISGRGSNMQALLEATLPGTVSAVISNNPEARAHLPWFCHPWFWGTGVAIFLLGSFKTTLASVLPPFALKPLDYVGVVGNMAGALIACPGFVPLVISEFEGSTTSPTAALADGPLPLAMLPLATSGLAWWMWIAVPLAMMGFLTVWLGGHAVTVLRGELFA